MATTKEIEEKLLIVQSLLAEIKNDLATTKTTDEPSNLLVEKNLSEVTTNARPSTETQSATDVAQTPVESTASVSSGEDGNEGPPLGEVGIFDGEFVFMPNDKKYQVPPNYASKSQLVSGDRLELISCGNVNEFKLVEQTKRIEAEGILTKKNFQWTVLIDKNEYLLIPAAVRYFNGEIGDKATVLLPEGYSENPPKWAALKEVTKMNVGSGGFAGSKSSEDIEKEKRQKYVPAANKVRSTSVITDNNTPLNQPKETPHNTKIVLSKPESKTGSVSEEPTAIEKTSPKGEVQLDKTSGEVELNLPDNKTTPTRKTSEEKMQNNNPSSSQDPTVEAILSRKIDPAVPEVPKTVELPSDENVEVPSLR